METEQEQIQEQQATQTSQSSLPKKSAWRWLWRGLFVLLFVLLAPVLFLATSVGQRTALELADKLIDQLTIGQVTGSLQDGLTLTDTRYQMDGVDVNVGQADLHLGFACLLDRAVCVENIAVKDTTVMVDTSKLPPSTEEKEQTQGEFNLPLSVSLKQLSLDNIKVSVDEMDIALTHFHSGISGKEKDLNLSPTLLQGLTLSLAPQAVTSDEKNAKKSEEKAQPVDWNALKQTLSKPLLTKLDQIKLPVNIDISEFKAEQINITQKVKNSEGEWLEPKSFINVSTLSLQAKSDASSVDLQQLDLESDKGSLHGVGKLTLSDNYPLDWQVSAKSAALAEFDIPESEVKATLSGALFDNTTLNIETAGAVKAQIQGDVQLAKEKTPFQLTLKSDQARYPFVDKKGVDPLVLEKVNLALTGDLLNYQLETSLSAKGMQLPESKLHLKGKGELTQFDVQDLSLNALQGKANLTGKVDWSNGVEWQSALALDGINTKSLLPEWSALLSGKLNTSGFAGRGKQADEWSVNVSEMDLHGNLLQRNLALKGALTADSKTLLNVSDTTLIYGENRIEMKGIIGDKSNFNADIKAPNLQGLVPNLKASIQGKVGLQGKVTEPSLDIDLTANNVSYDQLKLQHLTAKGKVSSEKQIQGDLALDLRQLNYGDVRIDNANLIASGSEANHTLKLTSKGEPVAANLQLAGKFDRTQQAWQGQLSQVTVDSPVGEWKNDKNVQVTYQNKLIKADISAHCWRNPKVTICLPQNFSAGKEGKVPFEIKQFDLAMVQEYLDPNSQITGLINAKGDAAWFSNKAPQVNVVLDSNRLTFTQKMEGKTFPITLTPVKVTANMADNNLKLNTNISIENNGRLTSDLVMKDIAKQRQLSGNINIERLNLALIKPLLSAGERVNGDINARLTLGGTALSPLLYGNLNLAGLTVRSNAMPFDVTGGNLALNFNGASSTLKGNVQTTESNLLLEGDANWQKLDAWHTRVKAQANRFRVNIPNMAKVDVSPNIEVKATPKELILGGNIDIPWARIAVEELPESAVAVSGDEVIMDGSAKNKTNRTALLNKNLPQNGAGMAIKADVSINIGDDVKLDAYGLKTDLVGTVKVKQGSKGLGLYGQVNLKNGTFASFGQDLLIRKGLISFTGSPSQPTLDIEAIRNPEAMEDSSVTAGVKVTGIADAPEVKVFSNPSMSQDQALSYILTGRGLENSGDAGSSNSIAAALIGMSLSKSSKTVGAVGSAFGISDLNVSTAGIGDNTKVVVSGSLTPKFKVKYGVGIFAPLTELTLRYRLAPSLYLQWVSSVNQAVDLMYRFEFD